MEDIINAAQIIELFGKDTDDEEIESLFEKLNTVNRPTIDPEDYDEDEDDPVRYNDWVLVKRKGLELGFSEVHYHTSNEFILWGIGDLLLTQVYFYSGGDDITPYAGELPYGLLFSDTQAIAREKLIVFEATRHSYLSDSWDVEGYRLNIQYNSQGTIDSIACIQKPHVIESEEVVSIPQLSDVIAYLGTSYKDAGFANLWCDDDELDLEQEIQINKRRYLNLQQSHGVFLDFSGKSQAALLKSITFYSDHEDSSMGWAGDLPLGITFEDDMQTLLNKVELSPVESTDSGLTCTRIWNLTSYTLFVLYSNIDNRVVQVKVMGRGYWQSTHGDGV